jgi:hypothetical protein
LWYIKQCFEGHRYFLSMHLNEINTLAYRANFHYSLLIRQSHWEKNVECDILSISQNTFCLNIQELTLMQNSTLFLASWIQSTSLLI